eukprot:XP_013963177.1 protein app1-like [Canis lupus familiaris]
MHSTVHVKRGENPAHESESARVPADPARPARGARRLTWARGGWPWALGACRASGCPSQAPTSMPRAQKLGKPSSGWRPETRGVRATQRQTDPRPQDGSTRILAAAKRAAHGSEHPRLPTGGRFRVPGNVGPARVARCDQRPQVWGPRGADSAGAAGGKGRRHLTEPQPPRGQVPHTRRGRHAAQLARGRSLHPPRGGQETSGRSLPPPLPCGAPTSRTTPMTPMTPRVPMALRVPTAPRIPTAPMAPMTPRVPIAPTVPTVPTVPTAPRAPLSVFQFQLEASGQGHVKPQGVLSTPGSEQDQTPFFEAEQRREIPTVTASGGARDSRPRIRSEGLEWEENRVAARRGNRCQKLLRARSGRGPGAGSRSGNNRDWGCEDRPGVEMGIR